MVLFILGSLELILSILIVIYYVKIKKVKRVDEIVFVNRSLYSLLLHIVNKIFKQEFVAITNAFNNRIHIISKAYFDSITNNDLLYKHELVHLYQIRKFGKLKFILKYLFFSIKYGYNKNELEIEAYELEKQDINYIKSQF